MQAQDREPVIVICLLAALADGKRTDEEQQQFAKITSRLGGDDVAKLLAGVQSGELTAEAAARQLSPEARRTAYEMAVTMVYADGDASPGEQAFLGQLRAALELDAGGLGELHTEAEGLAKASLAVPSLTGHTATMPTASRTSQAGIPAVTQDQALDAMIRRQALLTGALELMPQNIATLAIIPIQMRLVYRIGVDYGHKLDIDQIQDLLGALGIGAAGQVLDGVARRLLGGLGRGMFGRVLGGVVGGSAGVVAGAGVAFVTTYALGEVAKQYYAQGRQLSPEDLRSLFDRFRAEAEAMLPKVQQEIHAQSRHLDLPKLLATIRGTPA